MKYHIRYKNSSLRFDYRIDYYVDFIKQKSGLQPINKNLFTSLFWHRKNDIYENKKYIKDLNELIKKYNIHLLSYFFNCSIQDGEYELAKLLLDRIIEIAIKVSASLIPLKTNNRMGN